MTQQNQTLVKLENAGVLVNEKWLVRGVSLEIKKGKIITLRYVQIFSAVSIFAT